MEFLAGGLDAYSMRCSQPCGCSPHPHCFFVRINKGKLQSLSKHTGSIILYYYTRFKMSVVGVGIGDIWNIINGTITLCKNARNAEKGLQTAEKEMKLMKKTVRVLKDQIGDETMFVKERSDM